MDVGSYRRATGEMMVVISFWPGQGLHVLTLQEARRLRFLLGRVLDGIDAPVPAKARRTNLGDWDRGDRSQLEA